MNISKIREQFFQAAKKAGNTHVVVVSGFIQPTAEVQGHEETFYHYYESLEQAKKAAIYWDQVWNNPATVHPL